MCLSDLWIQSIGLFATISISECFVVVNMMSTTDIYFLVNNRFLYHVSMVITKIMVYWLQKFFMLKLWLWFYLHPVFRVQGNNSFRFLHDKRGGKSVENKSTSGLKLESKWLSSLGTGEKIGARSSAKEKRTPTQWATRGFGFQSLRASSAVQANHPWPVSQQIGVFNCSK